MAGLANILVQCLPVSVNRSVVSRASGLQRSHCLISDRQLRIRRLQGVPPSRRPVTLQSTASIHFLSHSWFARHGWLHLHVVQNLVCPLHSIQHWVVFHNEWLGLFAHELRQLVRTWQFLILSIVYSIMISSEQIVLAVYPVAHWPI